jgi:CBS domain-containing protein
MQSINIKVTARDSIRRFALTEAKLGALRQQISSLFDIKNDDANWSIKYKDKRQLVTLTSDEDLESAVQAMGKRVLHLVVVEDGVDLAENAENQERKVRRHEKRDRKCRHDESDDLVAKQRHGKRDRPSNPETHLARLQKKQNKLRDRLASLKAAENPKAQSQAAKVEQKLAAITSEIDSIATPPVSPPVSTQETATETRVVVPEATPAPTATVSAVSSSSVPLDPKLAKEVVNKFFSLHRDVKTEKKKIDSLVKVIHAMRVLSHLGEKANCPVAIDADQLALAQKSLVAMRTDIRSKKSELKQQKLLLKQLKKQGYTDKKLEKEEQKKKEKKNKKNEKKCRREKKMYKESRQEAKAQWHAEKAKRNEEKAARKAEKAKRKEEKASRKAEKALQ